MTPRAGHSTSPEHMKMYDACQRMNGKKIRIIRTADDIDDL